MSRINGLIGSKNSRVVSRIERFFDTFSAQMNERQTKVVNKIFEAAYRGFVGGMNVRKYIAITGTSKPTATRDLQQLVAMGAMCPIFAGRSTSYDLIIS